MKAELETETSSADVLSGDAPGRSSPLDSVDLEEALPSPENSSPWYIFKTTTELCTNIRAWKAAAGNTAACRAFAQMLFLYSLNLSSFLSAAWVLLSQGRLRHNALS